MGSDDITVIAGQLGRAPRDVTGVAVRCGFGFPVVIETAPVLADGSPNPTLLYLTCPALAATVSHIEAGGGVRTFRALCCDDPTFRHAVDEVTELYRARRAGLASRDEKGAPGRRVGPRLEAGIGGPSVPERASCLHAYAAAFLAAKAGWLRREAESGANDLAENVARMWVQVFPGIDEPWCADRRCARWTGRRRRAAVDVGTISVRLLVADIEEGRVMDVVRRAEVTRLGEGLGSQGRIPGSQGHLSTEAKDRTTTVVKRYVEDARSLGAGPITLVGTSAAREAVDGQAFIDGLGSAHDIAASVISGEEEARLTHAGVSLDVPCNPVVLDVGGGSTELVRRRGDGSLDWASLDIGASRATELWLGSDPPTVEEVEAIYGEAEAVFADPHSHFRVPHSTSRHSARTASSTRCANAA